MPRFTDRFLPPNPKYRKHRASGQAIVTLYGRDFYLGPHGTKASRIEYDRLVGEWLAAGRPSQMPSLPNDITIVELAAAYRRFAKDYYQKGGRPTDTIYQVQRATELLCLKYGRMPAVEFGPLSFQAFQASLVAKELSRKTVNHFASTVRRMFRWAVTRELIPVTVLQALVAVPNVPKGRTAARETLPVRPVEDTVVGTNPACWRFSSASQPEFHPDTVPVNRFSTRMPLQSTTFRPGYPFGQPDFNPDTTWSTHISRGI